MRLVILDSGHGLAAPAVQCIEQERFERVKGKQSL
jgi:hypothetical protein